MPTEQITVTNAGTRRVIIGPPPASKGGGKAVRFDTSADDKVPADKRLGRVHVLKDGDAERVRASKVVQAVKDRLELRIS
jgi:hypothetical protein